MNSYLVTVTVIDPDTGKYSVDKLIRRLELVYKVVEQ